MKHKKQIKCIESIIREMYYGDRNDVVFDKVWPIYDGNICFQFLLPLSEVDRYNLCVRKWESWDVPMSFLHEDVDHLRKVVPKYLRKVYSEMEVLV